MLLKSWVPGANRADGDFPLNNLPCGIFSTDQDEDPRCGMAIGDFVLDVASLEAEGLIDLPGGPYLNYPFWNEVMEAGPDVWAALRAQVTALLKDGASKRFLVEDYLVPLAEVTLHLPFHVAEYTDFFSGRHHAENVAAIAGAAGLPANYLHMPLGQNGRASTVVVSGTDIRRPWGQVKGAGFDQPAFQPSRRFDFELELGAVVGTASAMGAPVSVTKAADMIFGYVLLNDWSARDVQAWESQPLGPFIAKATATTISPWIVMSAALQAFHCDTMPSDQPPLPHLAQPRPMGLSIALQVSLTPEGGGETVISRSDARWLAYSFPQQLSHHTTTGCAMSVGDLLGSGTISGPDKTSRGSLLELSWGGREPLTLPGLTRKFIEDGDTITLSGHAAGDGFRIGFGTCSGKVLPALKDPFAG